MTRRDPHVEISRRVFILVGGRSSGAIEDEMKKIISRTQLVVLRADEKRGDGRISPPWLDTCSGMASPRISPRTERANPKNRTAKKKMFIARQWFTCCGCDFVVGRRFSRRTLIRAPRLILSVSVSRGGPQGGGNSYGQSARPPACAQNRSNPSLSSARTDTAA